MRRSKPYVDRFVRARPASTRVDTFHSPIRLMLLSAATVGSACLVGNAEVGILEPDPRTVAGTPVGVPDRPTLGDGRECDVRRFTRHQVRPYAGAAGKLQPGRLFQ